jgi:hypothetical protein
MAGDTGSSWMYPSNINEHTMKRIIAFVIFLIIVTPYSFGQHEETTHNDQTADHEGHRHKVTLVMAYSLLKNHVDETTNNILVVPTFGLNYDFLFRPKWGVGLHTDIVLQQFKVEEHDGHTELIRENPVAVCVVGLFKPLPSLTLIAGYGIELEKHENIQLIRLGVDYGFHLPGNWELGFALEFDQKINAYNSWVFGAGFSKLF